MGTGWISWDRQGIRRLTYFLEDEFVGYAESKIDSKIGDQNLEQGLVEAHVRTGWMHRRKCSTVL